MYFGTKFKHSALDWKQKMKNNSQNLALVKTFPSLCRDFGTRRTNCRSKVPLLANVWLNYNSLLEALLFQARETTIHISILKSLYHIHFLSVHVE